MRSPIRRTAYGCKMAAWAAIATFVFSGSALAADFEFPILGGNGGGFFKVTCPEGHFMAGIEGNAGTVVDHMRILCAPVTPLSNGGFTVGQIFNQGEIIGESPGGAFDQAICTKSRLVKEIRFNTEFFKDIHLVAFVKVVCTKAGSVQLDTFGFNLPAGEVRQECPGNTFAVGLRGRRGSFVDAIGLVCRSMPRPPA